MLRKVLFTICILGIFKNSHEAASRRYNFVISNVTCETLDKKSLKIFECNVEKLATSHYAYTGKLIFNKLMDKNLFIRYSIDASPVGKKNLIHFLDIKLGICNALETRFEVPFVQNFVIELRRTSNIPYQCPFKANFPYTFTNLSISDKFTNQFLPYLHFLQRTDLYEFEKLIGSSVTKGSILPMKKGNKL